MASIPHDQLFKELLQEFLPEFVALFFPETARGIDWSDVEFLNPELFTDLLEGTRRTLDLVARVRTLSGEPELLLLHVEVESDPRSEFPARMFDYYCVLRLRRRMPVLPIAIYLKPGHGGITRGEYSEQLLDLPVVSFRYHLVAIPDVPKEQLPAENPVRYALVPLLPRQGAGPVELLREAYTGIAHTGRDPARQVLLAHIAESYAGVGVQEIAELRASLASCEDQEVRKMTTIWHELGREEGLEQGLERGQEQGRVEGLRRSIRRLLEAQFGRLPASVEARLARVNSEQTLEELIVPASRAASLEEFARQLPQAE